MVYKLRCIDSSATAQSLNLSYCLVSPTYFPHIDYPLSAPRQSEASDGGAQPVAGVQFFCQHGEAECAANKYASCVQVLTQTPMNRFRTHVPSPLCPAPTSASCAGAIFSPPRDHLCAVKGVEGGAAGVASEGGGPEIREEEAVKFRPGFHKAAGVRNRGEERYARAGPDEGRASPHETPANGPPSPSGAPPPGSTCTRPWPSSSP